MNVRGSNLWLNLFVRNQARRILLPQVFGNFQAPSDPLVSLEGSNEFEFCSNCTQAAPGRGNQNVLVSPLPVAKWDHLALVPHEPARPIVSGSPSLHSNFHASPRNKWAALDL